MNFLDTLQTAKELIGCLLVHESEEGITSGVIIETEAYLQDDSASHSYNGLTARNAPMFGKPGTAYIYFTYGMHYCFNVVTNNEGVGEAVLIRALKPVDGIDLMIKRRKRSNNLCDGPAKLVQAMGITKEFNGHDLRKPPLYIKKTNYSGDIITTTRIGISKGKKLPYRFLIKNFRK